jgi:hypothetical protein
MVSREETIARRNALAEQYLWLIGAVIRESFWHKIGRAC